MGTNTAPAWLVHCSASSKLNHKTLLPLLQGAEYVDGFAGGASGGGLGSRGRCFRCGQAGHWEDACPLLAARIADQEAELAAWRGNEPAADASAVPAGGGTEQQQSLNPVEGAGSAGTAGLSLPATALVGYPQHRAAAAAAAAVAAGNSPPPQPAALGEAALPLSEARRPAPVSSTHPTPAYNTEVAYPSASSDQHKHYIYSLSSAYKKL